MLSETGMGSLKSTFGPNWANAKIILYVMPVFIVVGLILIASIPVGGVAMWLIAAGLFWGYRAQMGAKADVYEHGIVAKDWLGRVHSFRWEDVTAVYEFVGYHQRGFPNQWVYTVHTQDGQRVKLDMTYETVRNLGHVVLTETGRRLLPKAQEILGAGRAVSFGESLAVSAGGFVSGGETLAWDQADRIRLDGMLNLTIHRQGQRLPWKMVLHSHIANFPTFRAVLHEAVKGTLAEVALEDPLLERAQAAANQPKANIGTVSAAINYDVRELLMQGYTMPEIQRVAKGEISLKELMQAGPQKKNKQR